MPVAMYRTLRDSSPQFSLSQDYTSSFFFFKNIRPILIVNEIKSLAYDFH